MCKKKATRFWDGKEPRLLTTPDENGRKCQESLYFQNPMKQIYLCECHAVNRGLIW
jgi:hypothetical protein